MKVGIITYNFPHLKTEQVIENLLFYSPHLTIKLYGITYVPRKLRTTLIQHRPDQTTGIAPEVIARKHKLDYTSCECDNQINDECDIYMICGANILSPKTLKNKKIINSHPGILPYCRGLDAFKWAIYNMQPLGVTLHFIDENIDAGRILFIAKTAVYQTDSLQTLARRHYENEIKLLSDFEKHINSLEIFSDSHRIGKCYRRMPLSIEKNMVRVFDEYIEEFSEK